MKKIGLYLCCLSVLVLASCKSSRTADSGTIALNASEQKVMTSVVANNVLIPAVTAKMKFDITYGNKNISVGGNLKMKRDDVIQLSLVGFGIFEAGRMEFTRDKVLVVDRINKQYIEMPYEQVSFLKEADLDFDVLQALFWDELFIPGKSVRTNLHDFSVVMNNNQEYLLKLRKSKKLFYQFVAAVAGGMVKETKISSQRDPYALNWKYGKYTNLMSKQFPTYMGMTVDGISTPLTVDISLSRLAVDSDWETRTTLSGKYKKVSPEEVMKKLMAL